MTHRCHCCCNLSFSLSIKKKTNLVCLVLRDTTIWSSREELKTNWTEQNFNSLSIWSHPGCLPHHCNRNGPRGCISTYPKNIFFLFLWRRNQSSSWAVHRIWLNMTTQVPFYNYWLWNLPQLWFHFFRRKTVQCTTEKRKWHEEWEKH